MFQPSQLMSAPAARRRAATSWWSPPQAALKAVVICSALGRGSLSSATRTRSMSPRAAVQGCLLALAARDRRGVGVGRDSWCVGVGARRHQDGPDLLRVAAVAGPVGEEMEQGALAGRFAVFDDPDAGELGMFAEESTEMVGLTALGGGGCLHRQRVVPA